MVVVFLSQADADNKSVRTKVHQLIAKLYPSLESATQDGEGQKVIVVSRSKGI